MQLIRQNYDLDFVLCLDCTGSFGHFIHLFRENIDRMLEGFRHAMQSNGRQVDRMRVKLICFKDYAADDAPMVESVFFDCDTEREALHTFLQYAEESAGGGGDCRENALEALALAIRSDWSMREEHRARHIIALFTDAPPLPLGEREDCAGYPADMPRNLRELEQLWEGNMNRAFKRLFLFAPEAAEWNEINESWSRCCHFPCEQATCMDLWEPDRDEWDLLLQISVHG